MNQMSALKLRAVALVVLPLAGCGGGGSPAVSSPTINASTQSVTPSLGQFDENTHVVIYTDLNKTTSLGDGFISKDGSVTINVGTYKGPYVAVIDGKDPQNAGKGYYDEAQKTWEPLGARQLRALNPDNTQNQNIGVTVLTELAAKYYETHYTPTLTAGNINVANAMIQAAIKNAPPLLTPPALVGQSTQANSLDWNGSDQEKYALILAALAQSEKSSDSQKTAANLIEDLGSDNDLAAGKINLPANISQHLQTAAKRYADTATQMQMATVAFAAANDIGTSTNNTGLISVDLPQPASISIVTGTDISQAKMLFSDLRSARLALSSNSTASPGFYQTVGQNIISDIQNNVKHHGNHFFNATFALMSGAKMLNDLSNGHAANYYQETSLDPNGNVTSTSYSTFDTRGGAGCLVTVPAGTQASSVTSAECLYNWALEYWDPTVAGYVYTNFQDIVSISKAGSGYSYTITAYSYADTVTAPTGTPVGTASGTITQTFDTNNNFTGGGILGGLPIDAGKGAPGDTASLNMNVNRSDDGNGHFTYGLSGSYTYLSNGSPAMSFSIDGSKIGTQSVNIAGNEHIVSGLLNGVLQTPTYEYDGALTLDNYQTDKSTTTSGPTTASFAGIVKDRTQPATALPLFNGSIGAELIDFSNYDATQPDSATNYLHVAGSLGGTLNMPNQSPLSLMLGVDRTGWRKARVSLDYRYGKSDLFGVADIVAQNGNSPADSNQVMTVNSSYGVKVTLTRLASTGNVTGQVTINTFNPLVANISGNWIHYIDGSSETLF